MDRALSEMIVTGELERAIAMGKGAWTIVRDPNDPLVFTVEMTNRNNNQKFIFEFQCNDYNQIPPYIEMVDPITGQKGVPSAYPSGDSIFHGNKVICNPCNRKAYAGHSGLHSEWQYGDWTRNAKGMSNLAGIISTLYRHVQRSTGRMG